jgi:hypothetical protein
MDRQRPSDERSEPCDVPIMGRWSHRVLLSRDGGRTWTPSPDAPAVAVIAWPTRASLHGVSSDGTIRHSADGGGTTWTERSMVEAEPESLYVEHRKGVENIYSRSLRQPLSPAPTAACPSPLATQNDRRRRRIQAR